LPPADHPESEIDSALDRYFALRRACGKEIWREVLIERARLRSVDAG
jgi:hypothetical protein